MTADRLDDPDLPLKDLMARWPDTIPVFIWHRMLCVSCPISPFHRVTDACAEWSRDQDSFTRALTRAVTPSRMK